MRTLATLTLALATLLLMAARLPATSSDRWSPEELKTITSLRLAELGPPPADPSNRWADDAGAAELGRTLFFDARLSSNGRVACASCHLPERGFQDGLPLGRGVGVTARRTMPLAGTAWSPWQFWDGRKDSPWAQALGPLESAVEHGSDRAALTHLIASHHRAGFERVFGPLPSLDRVPASAGPNGSPEAQRAWAALDTTDRDAVTRVFVGIGKAIAAYERTLRPGASRFDRYADALATTGRAPAGLLSDDERAGLRLFVGKAGCVDCHNGPRLTDDQFHDIGTPALSGGTPDRGRALGAHQVAADEFNCRSRWSDAPAGSCRELEFMVADGPELEHAFKTPSLRGVAARAPYMHAGQFADLAGVIDHYDRAPRGPSGRSELEPLRLTRRERARLLAFLATLEPAADPAVAARGVAR